MTDPGLKDPGTCDCRRKHDLRRKKVLHRAESMAGWEERPLSIFARLQSDQFTFLPHLLARSVSHVRELEAGEELSIRKFNPRKCVGSSILSDPLGPQYYLKDEQGPFAQSKLHPWAQGPHAWLGWGGSRGAPRLTSPFCFYSRCSSHLCQCLSP